MKIIHGKVVLMPEACLNGYFEHVGTRVISYLLEDQEHKQVDD